MVYESKYIFLHSTDMFKLHCLKKTVPVLFFK